MTLGWRYWLAVVAAWCVVGVALAGCASDRDYAGNRYPPECPPGMVVDAYIEYVDRATLDRLAKTFGKPDLYGLTVRLGEGPAFVWILNDRSIPTELRQDVRRHELCHVVMGKWHD